MSQVQRTIQITEEQEAEAWEIYEINIFHILHAFKRIRSRLASFDFDPLVIWRTRDPMSFTLDVIFSFNLCFVSWFQIADAILMRMLETEIIGTTHTLRTILFIYCHVICSFQNVERLILLINYRAHCTGKKCIATFASFSNIVFLFRYRFMSLVQTILQWLCAMLFHQPGSC